MAFFGWIIYFRIIKNKRRNKSVFPSIWFGDFLSGYGNSGKFYQTQNSCKIYFVTLKTIWSNFIILLYFISIQILKINIVPVKSYELVCFEILSSTPIAVKLATKAEPPYEIKGRGTPVSGRSAVIDERLTIA